MVGAVITTTDGKRMRRVSRWIKLRNNFNPSPRNRLWDYVTDSNGYHPYQDKFQSDTALDLYYFRFGGRNYALEQFYVFGSVFLSGPPIMYEDENGKLGVIGTIDMDGDLFHPLYGEWDECCEHVRLYEEVR